MAFCRRHCRLFCGLHNAGASIVLVRLCHVRRGWDFGNSRKTTHRRSPICIKDNGGRLRILIHGIPRHPPLRSTQSLHKYEQPRASASVGALFKFRTGRDVVEPRFNAELFASLFDVWEYRCHVPGGRALAGGRWVRCEASGSCTTVYRRLRSRCQFALG